MSEAITVWLGTQQKAVAVSGRHAEKLTLIGPDDKPWAQWPMNSKKLADEVEQVMIQLAETLPNGKHRGQLVVFDNKGDQCAAYPVVLPGRNPGAATAAAEARTLQQATALAISNLDVVLTAMRNVLESVLAQNELLREDNATLVETINEFRTQNLEVDLKIREHEEKKERLDKLAEQVGPVLQMFASHFGEKVIAKALAAQKKKEAKSEQQSNGTGASGSGGGGANGAEPSDSAVSNSDNGGQEGVAADSAASGAGHTEPSDAGDSGRRRQANPRKRQRAPLKPKATRARARAASEKPLTRKGK